MWLRKPTEEGCALLLTVCSITAALFNKWLDRERIYEGKEGYAKGAFIEKDSPYHDYFMFHDENRFPYNPTYDGWWGHDTLPKLNYEGSRQLYEYIMKIAAKWVSPPFNADG